MKQTILALSAAVAVLALAPSANAAVINGISFAPGVLTDGFTGSVSNGGFNDVYNFTLPVNSDALGLVSSIGFSGKPGDVNFTSVTLDDLHPFSVVNGGFDSSAAVFVTGLAAGSGHFIRVVGSSLGNGSYSGNITLYPAVPEPATWAMMIAGFGLAGVALRRRSTAARNMAVSFV